MVWIAGLFLVAHGLIHLAIWLPKADPKAPFDAGHSPFAGNVRHTAAAMAVAAAVVLAAATASDSLAGHPGGRQQPSPGQPSQPRCSC
ncbi:hypothetical protein JOE40_003556 [Arthrobacter sp. PvP102]|uniref:hypothetical protein n=1 Tax=unclassified Arthrobacter TaxID=235627 RepID=UPI001AE19C49|nr:MULTISPECIES: hypothetical protein [unclassified Arthrobacter]MBP1233913.1 hypothetical protein [Arthrobacter sp. PvP103]MBP1239047.1 hypothetical protein [Arthrobacter sp. PvP102]